MLHILRRRAVFGGVAVADGTELHKDFLLLPVVALGGSGQTVDVFCADGVQHIFSNSSPGVVTLVHDDHAVILDKRVHVVALPKRRDHGNIQYPAQRIASAGQCADDAFTFFAPPFWGDVLRQILVDLQELFKIFHPIFHNLGVVNQNQRVDLALCYQIRTDSGLTKGSCGAEHAGIMFKYFRGGVCLLRVQGAFEIRLDFTTCLAFVTYCVGNSNRVQLRGQLFRTAARQMDIFPDILSAENDARNISGGKPQRFLFIKLRVAVGSQPPHGVLQTRLQACGVNVNAVGKCYRKRLSGILRMENLR